MLVAGSAACNHEPDAYGSSAGALTVSEDVYYAPARPPKQCRVPIDDIDTLAWKPTDDFPAFASFNRCSIHGDVPLHRNPGAIAWDPTTRQLIVVAGQASVKDSTSGPFPATLQDTWSFRLGADPSWTMISDGTQGDGLPPRFAAIGIVDPVAHRVVVHGGQFDQKWTGSPYYEPGLHLPESDSPIYTDVRVLPLTGPAEWTALPLDYPGEKHFEAAHVYDPVTHRWYLHGGRSPFGAAVGQDTRYLDLTEGAEQWQIVDTATKPTGVPQRVGATAVYDGARRRFVLIGGLVVKPTKTALSDAWALPLDAPETGWIPLLITNPEDGPGMGFHLWQGFHEPKADRYYLHGGVAYWGQEWFDYSMWNPNTAHDVWGLIPNDDDTLTWYRLRTTSPDGWPLGSPVFWDSKHNLGISAFGPKWGGDYGGGLGGPKWMVNEIRVLMLFEPKDLSGTAHTGQVR